eukprot:4945855-Amphidinium_carterae.1
MRANLSSAPNVHSAPLNTKKNMFFKTNVNTFRTYFFNSHWLALRAPGQNPQVYQQFLMAKRHRRNTIRGTTCW